jgi:hypothetical protein
METAGLKTECFTSAEVSLDACNLVPEGYLLLQVRIPILSGPHLQAELTRRKTGLPVRKNAARAFISRRDRHPCLNRAAKRATRAIYQHHHRPILRAASRYRDSLASNAAKRAVTLCEISRMARRHKSHSISGIAKLSSTVLSIFRMDKMVFDSSQVNHYGTHPNGRTH